VDNVLKAAHINLPRHSSTPGAPNTNSLLSWKTKRHGSTFFQIVFRKRNGVIAAVTALRAGLTRNSGSVPAWARNTFFHFQGVQMGSGAHPGFYSMDTAGTFPRVRRNSPKCLHGLHNHNLLLLLLFLLYRKLFTFGRKTQVREEYEEFCIHQRRIKSGRVRCFRYINKFFYGAQFEILTMVTTHVEKLRDVTPYILTQICWYFGKTAASKLYTEVGGNR
jgi:hypothetical protein